MNWVKVAIRIERADGVTLENMAGLLGQELGLAVEIVENVDMSADLQVYIEQARFSANRIDSVLQKLRLMFRLTTIASPVISIEPDTDWLAKWRRSVKPEPLGEKIMVIPTWRKTAASRGRIPVILDPGMAFGSGHHATTAGCVQMLEKYNASKTLDIGCGSGILAIVSAKLGAEQIVAVDIDPSVVPTAVRNVELNEVGSIVSIFNGGVESVDGLFDVIVANLYLDSLAQMADELGAKLVAGGTIILSGFQLRQAGHALDTYRNAGFYEIERVTENEWVTLALKRK